MTTTQKISREQLKQQLIECNQNAAGVFEVGEDTICAMMALLQEEDSEPVYQVNDGVGSHTWSDVTKDVFDLYSDQRKRIAYAAPPAPVAVPDEIVGWVRDENGDSRDPLFLCGSVKPDMGKAYSSQYFPVKRAAMQSEPATATAVKGDVRNALTLALQAMEFMGDTLNSLDAVCTEDVEQVTPAFEAVRKLLAADPEEPVTAANTLPDGWKLVPKSPTPEMTHAAHQYYQNAMTKFGDFAPLGIYTSMLAAAPAAPTGWIPCSERMPPVNRSIWIYSPTRGVKAMFALVENGKFFYDLQRDEDDIDDATHWMPENAPAAPEQDIKNEN
ncbi:DUF551 domain-containing protein [Kosakonia radicincitans]|uniref:DUF551 domain-containing protein n=1 Tax=Kosakonia radicincitans TaxID=283686 RepID=UPI001D093955|nr:DUF551 domain-containing protein [Kosakonia radicincitans]